MPVGGRLHPYTVTIAANRCGENTVTVEAVSGMDARHRAELLFPFSRIIHVQDGPEYTDLLPNVPDEEIPF